ncbi:rRNA maturation RNase YbeY [Alteribacillus iranensis]|uniref:Endoribonuclease YbeY n=1 Tax=Alteribacillus iranensis TaxID=930128 RepID=A0A1I1ZCD7_9BACI|nr:rRNA maturation RNase YbeY [Alteribacillus iranensis]SFE28988.1 probable rRNA maturation factor [Alteribacillus iranensis]
MSVTIDIIDETNSLTKEDNEWITQLLQLACTTEDVREDSELSLTITDNKRIQIINKEYRGKDAATDVISFALNEGEEEFQMAEMEAVPNLLGDIIISIDKAKEQAETYGHSLERELGFLAVHGLLHLLGYDHDTSESERSMFGRQEMILTEYGLTR